MMIKRFMVHNKTMMMQSINLVDAKLRKLLIRIIEPGWRVSVGRCGK